MGKDGALNAGPIVPDAANTKKEEKSFFVLDVTAFQICLFLR